MLEFHDQVSKAARAGVSRYLDTGTAVGSAMMDATRQYVSLNLNMARVTLEHNNLAARQLISARDSRQFLSLAAAQIQPNALRIFDYGYYLTSIAAGTQTRIIRAAGDCIAETNREWIELAGEAGDNGYHGWKTAVAFVRNLVESALRLQGELAGAFQSALRRASPAQARPDAIAPRLAIAGPARTYS